jgi:hypothetical protein
LVSSYKVASSRRDDTAYSQDDRTEYFDDFRPVGSPVLTG